MKTSSKVWVALVVVAIIAIGGYLYPKVQQLVGANPGPDVDSECASQNGLETCKVRKGLTLATTTPCSVRSPTGTSTLVYTSLQITTATSTVTTWTLATSTNAFATTSALNAAYTLASGAEGSVQFTGTTTELGVNFEDFNTHDLLPPNSWVVWGVAGIGTSMSNALLLGTCSAEFNTL